MFYNEYTQKIDLERGITVKVYDFSLPISSEMKCVWPGDPSPTFEQTKDFVPDRYLKYVFSMANHTGTHMDAPVHLFPGKKTITDYDADKFVGEGIVLDIKCGEKYWITVEDLEKAGSEIKKGDIVFICTGWGSLWETKDTMYLFSNRPGLTPEAAEWLVNKEIKAVGIDTFNIEHADAEKGPVHKVFLPADIIIVEAMRGLEQVAGKRGIICVGALPLEGKDGAPARVFGIFND